MQKGTDYSLTLKTNMKKEETLQGDSPCADCGTDENIMWHTDNIFWNLVMDDNVVGNERCSILLNNLVKF